MGDLFGQAQARRAFLKTGALVAGSMVVSDAVAAGLKIAPPKPAPIPAAGTLKAPAPVPAAPVLASSRVVRPALMRQAMAALQRHGSRIAQRDRMAVVDFSVPSANPRFHFVNLANGHTETLLVTHGSGSDPGHTGWLRRFSNEFNSNASCEGAFLASDYYVGKHGKSQRLIGLDNTNDNALGRAIVIHGAWYANKDMLRTHGMLGRSQGCFAVGERDLAQVFERLGPGRMIYAAKV